MRLDVMATLARLVPRFSSRLSLLLCMRISLIPRPERGVVFTKMTQPIKLVSLKDLRQTTPKAGVSVTVASESGIIPSGSVTVRPLPQNTGVQSTSPDSRAVIGKVLLKAESKGGRKISKTFSLRNINTCSTKTCAELKAVIKEQLCDHITSNFDIGYLQGSTAVIIRNEADLAEVWEKLKKSTSVTLWCDGLKKQSSESKPCHKRQRMLSSMLSDSNESDSDESVPTKRKKTENQVSLIIASLKKQHGDLYSPMQYRIWGEMKAGGLHESLSDPPSTSMFMRTGSKSTEVKKREASTGDSISLAINHLASAIAPKTPSAQEPAHNIPATIIENRSKCYKQLSELKNLWESDLLSDEEYAIEREAIMGMLRSLGKQ